MENVICDNPSHPERRRAFRMPYHSPVHYTNPSVNGAGTIKDISSSGMFMETPFPLTVGDQLSIAFLLRNSKRPMIIEGIITRSTLIGVGVQFLWS